MFTGMQRDTDRLLTAQTQLVCPLQTDRGMGGWRGTEGHMSRCRLLRRVPFQVAPGCSRLHFSCGKPTSSFSS